MDEKFEISDELVESINKITNFVDKLTGTRPSQKEIAKTLNRYFILKEILEQIKWERDNPEE